MRKLISAVALATLAVGCSKQEAPENAASTEVTKPAEPVTLTVYSARKEHLIKPLFDLYTEKTGVQIQYITDKASPLLSRLKSEGENTPADMLITVDAGNLWKAAEDGVLRSVDSQTLETNVPANLQDDKNQWFGLSIRARTIVYAKDRVKEGELSTYEGLADENWKGRLCLRTSKKVYNQSLVASMISNLGEEKAEQVVAGWVNNLATDVFSNDTKAMNAVQAGQCDATVVNTYYYGRLQKKTPDANLAIFWPNQEDRGVHINISGAGVTKHAKHPAEATALLEWLSSDEAQQQFAQLNQEYPVNVKVSASEEVKAWGDFKRDSLNVSEAGRLQPAAVKLMDRVNYR
ncbi:extracellular solute-binding protein [Litoribrevibacter albus]|uniref:Binding protein component of ABC iron transporter n=1 Tax=Litoribrevibacter albus TaxID=1473156 RepID=A0AA37W974_9GAMM|nr:extracellular solute-binding protein [Litoribrevibacter albus]GLQ33133.1 putative binding protein component of ABC iron transporter [Litoribrevibacter albus]